ncbi:MAG: type II toxin-antitoxin system VapC family toxin [Candidatus Tumulicola sp.]
MRIVLDASSAVSWLFRDERTPLSIAALHSVREHGALVPPLWCTEIVQALLKSERRGRIDYAQSQHALELLRALPIVVQTSPEIPTFSEVALARKFALSAYDACYLDLSLRYGLPLVTLDKKLASAADAVGLRWKPEKRKS